MKMVQELVAGASKEELIWLNGYLAGLVAAEQPAQTTETPKAASKKITIAYGTETGNAKKLATAFAAKAKKSGVQAKLVSLDQYKVADLPKESYFLTVISTQGDGEPPAGAKKFYDHIHNNGFQIKGVKYGVLALGDTSYPLFCKAGEDVDEQLGKLGGERFIPLQKCDTDYEAEAEAWFGQVMQKLNSASAVDAVVVQPAVKKATGKKIYTGTLLTNINLNDRGSIKQTHHLEISAEDVVYAPGDSLGIVPENPVGLVNTIISFLGADKNKVYRYKGEERSLYEWLHKKLNIVHLPERVVSKYAALVGQDIPATRIGLLDLLKIYPVKDLDQLEELIDLLEPIAPRLYSISSSPEAHSGEIHLTVARDKFTINGETKYGLCSDFFCQLPVGGSFEFYIHKNDRFRLPSDDKDVIMVGPGTGIAPFRSFLAHRDATGAPGKNWLFFGDQHFVTDFLYQSELQDWVKTDVLTKIDVAFSRDQKEKVYVQHKMRKHGAELFEWLENGAYFYICGAKEPMSVDVENTLIEIIQEYGRKTEMEAITYLEQLKEEERYLQDVY
jgi:sulfite reductase (NADPH) flavoprotein alpha-component